ncbi:hypothetical protein F1291_000155 [Clostridioides difficile]
MSKFKEKPDADGHYIARKYKCYDMPLDTTLNYNQSTEANEGTINYNQDPEYLNVFGEHMGGDNNKQQK